MMLVSTLFLACGQPAHMQYDFGRSFNESVALQGTLDRASAANAAYPLGGAEALKVREATRSAATDKEKGTPTVTATVSE